MVSRETLKPERFFDLSDVQFKTIFDGISMPWEILGKGRKEEWIRAHLESQMFHVKQSGMLVLEDCRVEVDGGIATIEAGAYFKGSEVNLSKNCHIEAGSWVIGPTILGEGTVARHGAYVRGGILTGKQVVIGHSTEVKSSIFLNFSKAPHFNYVGDSILGNSVNLGAGTKVSNLKVTGSEVRVRFEEERLSTGLRKFGAIIGDGVETGCNSVLNPGVLLGKKSVVCPNVSVQNRFYPEKSWIQ